MHFIHYKDTTAKSLLRDVSPASTAEKAPGRLLSRIEQSRPSTVWIDLYIAFTLRGLFGEGCTSPEFNHEAWITSITEDKVEHCVSRTALNCLATAYFGRQKNRPEVVAEGAYLYVKALAQLKSAIEDSTTAFDSRNVAATMALAQYETLVYTNEYGWVHHAGGMGRLMEIRGPKSYQDEPDHTYFLLSRFSIINQAAVSRKSTFLSEPDWIIVPWAKHPHSRTTSDAITDVFAHVPGIFEEFDRLSESAGVDSRPPPGLGRQYTGWLQSGRAQGPEQSSWDRFRMQIIHLLSQCEQWRSEWERSKRCIPRLRPIDTASSLTWDPKLQYPSSPFYEYPDLPSCHEVLIYLTTYASLAAVGAMLRNPLQIVSLVAGPHLSRYSGEVERVNVESPSLPGLWMRGPDLADWIVRQMDYALQEKHRGKTVLTVLMLLRIW